MRQIKPQGTEFRPDIQGLRAVAILLVVACHYGVSFLQGGYIGVDVFFVLSGYLITAILLNEYQEHGGINFLRFYLRRLQRLLPALLFMIIIISIVSAFLLSPLEQINEADISRFASLWTSNIYFAMANLEYFDEISNESIFLHTWSLGVEEQFYLVWPVLLVAILASVKTRDSKFQNRRLLGWMLCLLVLSFACSFFLSYTETVKAFYLMPARAWQFAAGAITCLVAMKINNLEKGRQLAGVTGITGMLAILIAATLINRNLVYPGIWVLLPTFGTALVLLSGKLNPDCSSSRMLSLKPMQMIGNLSYSWYLWHWPVLMLGKKIIFGNEHRYTLLFLCAGLLMSVVSYSIVERPLRYHRSLLIHTKRSLCIFLLLMASVFAGITFWQQQAGHWAQSPEQLKYKNARLDLPVIYQMGCDEWFYSDRLRVCLFGPAEATNTVVLLGDSAAGQWFPALHAGYVNQGWRIIVLTKSSCPIVDVPYFSHRLGRVFTECKSWRDTALQYIKSIKPDEVFIGTTIVSFNKKQWITGTSRVMQKIHGSVGDIYIMRATPILPYDGLLCLSQKNWQQQFFDPENYCSSPAPNQREKNIHAWLLSVTEKYNNIHMLDLNSSVCPDKTCYAEYSGDIIYRDSRHLTATFAESLANTLIASIMRLRTREY